MLEYRVIFGILAVLAGIAAYIAYFRNIFSGRTRPHAFTWLTWGILAGIAFAAQVSGKAGPGAWVTGVTAAACMAVFFVALFRGERNFPMLDWLCLAGAALAIGVWLFTKDPVGAVLLIILTDALAFAPTFRKGYDKPHEETATTFALNGLKFGFAILALDAINPVTALYPAYLVSSNSLFVILLIIRRRQAEINTALPD